MKDEITNALTVLIESFIQTKDFVLAQAPDVIHQLIAYNTMKYTIWLWVMGIITAIAYAGIIRMGFWEWEADNEIEATLWVGAIVGGILTIITTCVAMEYIKLTIAPKVWLLEYAAELAR